MLHHLCSLPLNRRQLLLVDVGDDVLIIVVMYRYIVVWQLLPLKKTVAERFYLMPCERAQKLNVLVGPEQLCGQQFNLAL